MPQAGLVYDAAAMAGLRWVTLASAVSSCGWSSFVRAAEAVETRAGVEWSYEASPGCPGRGEFLARLHRRMNSNDAARAEAAPRRFEIRVDAGEGRAVGLLTVVDSRGARSSRRIDAATCDEAVDALALIAALTLSREHEPDREGEVTSEPAPADRNFSPRDESTDSDQSEAAAPSREQVAFGATVSAVVATGAAPGAGVGPELAVESTLADLFVVDLHAFAGARLGLPQSTETEDGTAELSLVTGIIGACAGRSGELSVWGCALAEVGQLSASGSETERPRDSTRRWSAAGAAIVVDFVPASPVFFRAGLGLLAPLDRDRFLLGDRVVFEVPAVAVRGQAGAGVRFW